VNRDRCYVPLVSEGAPPVPLELTLRRLKREVAAYGRIAYRRTARPAGESRRRRRRRKDHRAANRAQRERSHGVR
jgi:ribosomal protein S21